MREKTKYIKDNKEITDKYISALYQWLINETTAKEFFDGDYKAKAWNDFDYFNGNTTDREHLVMPNEILLIDREIDGVHCFVICKVSKSKERQRVKDLHKIVEVSKVKYWRAGYWLLPRFNFFT